MNTEEKTSKIRMFAIGVLLSCSLATTCAHADTTYFPLTPCRTIDTRDGSGVPLAGQATRSFTVRGSCDVPSDAKAVSYNATIVQPDASGYLSLFPDGAARPMVSALNFTSGAVVGNGGVVALGDGETDLAAYLGSASAGTAAHLVIDVTGYFR